VAAPEFFTPRKHSGDAVAMAQIVIVSVYGAVVSTTLVPAYVPSAARSCGAAKAGVVAPRAASDAPVRSAIRRCEVVVIRYFPFSAADAVVDYYADCSSLEDRAVGTQHAPPPCRNIPLIPAYRGIPAKAKR